MNHNQALQYLGFRATAMPRTDAALATIAATLENLASAVQTDLGALHDLVDDNERKALQVSAAQSLVETLAVALTPTQQATLLAAVRPQPKTLEPQP